MATVCKKYTLPAGQECSWGSAKLSSPPGLPDEDALLLARARLEVLGPRGSVRTCGQGCDSRGGDGVFLNSYAPTYPFILSMSGQKLKICWKHPNFLALLEIQILIFWKYLESFSGNRTTIFPAIILDYPQFLRTSVKICYILTRHMWV